MEAEEFIEEMQQSFSGMTDGIIHTVCSRAVRSMNKVDPTSISSTDGYPARFNFFDVLSIEFQDNGFSSISPYLEDLIDAELEKAYNSLPRIEREVLYYALVDYSEDSGMDQVYDAIRDSLVDMLNEHWSSSNKIQRYNLSL